MPTMFEMHAVKYCQGKFVVMESGNVEVSRCPVCNARMYRMVEAK